MSAVMLFIRQLYGRVTFAKLCNRFVKRIPAPVHYHVSNYHNFCSVFQPVTLATKPKIPQAAVLLQDRTISTLKRRVFKIKKHKKKKRKKRLSRLSIIPWKPPSEEKKRTYQLPYKMRRIVKERRRRNKGNRTLRVPRQR